MPTSNYLKNLGSKIGNELLLLPSATAIIRDEDNRILLQQKAENIWSLPAGAIEPGESPAQAIVREVFEETELIVRPQRVACVFGGVDGFRFTYSNGDEVEYTVIVFECEIVGGNLGALDDKTVKLEYFTPEEMPELPIKYPRQMFLQSGKDTIFLINAKLDPK